jgi:rare lipoprotein A
VIPFAKLNNGCGLRINKYYILLLILFFCTGCADKKYNGHYKIGPVYKKNGEKYVPTNNIKYIKTGLASWYGSKGGFHGRKTANGDRYNKNMLTAAHPTLPLPSMIKVTNLKNNKSLILMVNDRGPFKKNRILDVSEKAADLLGFKRHGITKVDVEYLPVETKDLHNKLAIVPKHGAKAKGKMKDQHCSVDCYIKMVNKKKKLHGVKEKKIMLKTKVSN